MKEMIIEKKRKRAKQTVKKEKGDIENERERATEGSKDREIYI